MLQVNFERERERERCAALRIEGKMLHPFRGEVSPPHPDAEGVVAWSPSWNARVQHLQLSSRGEHWTRCGTHTALRLRRSLPK
jgi:hypothetical protein